MTVTTTSDHFTHANDAVKDEGKSETSEKLRSDNGSTAIGTVVSDIGNKLSSGTDIIKHLGLDKLTLGEQDGSKQTEPTAEQHQEAQGKLDGQISTLLTPDDQKTLGDMQTAILSGDEKALGSTIAGLQNQPEKLQSFIKEINKNFQAAGSSIRVETNSQGQVIVHDGGTTAVVYSPDGKSSVHESKTNPDGSITLGGEVVNGVTPSQAMKSMGDGASHDITDGNDTGEMLPKSTRKPLDLDRGHHIFRDPGFERPGQLPRDIDPGFERPGQPSRVIDPGFSRPEWQSEQTDPGYWVRNAANLSR